MIWNKIFKYIIGIGIIIGCYFRVANILTYPPLSNLFSDPERHWLYSQRVPEQYLFSAIDPIGYQVWLRMVTTFTLNDSNLFNIYTAILSLFTAFIWYKVLTKLNPQNKNLNLFGLLVFVWLPSWIEIFSYTMTETLFIPLLGFSLYYTLKLKEKINLSHKDIILLSLTWTFCVLTRFVAAPIAFISLIYILYPRFKLNSKADIFHIFKKVNYKHLLIIVSTMSIVLGLVGYRNYLIINSFSPFGYGAMNKLYVLSGTETINVNIHRKGINTESWWFGSPSINTRPLEPLSDWKSDRSGQISINPDINNGLVGWEQDLINNRLTWNKYTKIIQENFLFFFFGESWPDSNRTHFFSLLSYQTRWIWFPLFLIVSILNILYISGNKRVHYIQIIVTVTTLLVMFNYSAIMEGRYRKPFEGLWLLNLFWLLPRLWSYNNFKLNWKKSN